MACEPSCCTIRTVCVKALQKLNVAEWSHWRASARPLTLPDQSSISKFYFGLPCPLRIVCHEHRHAQLHRIARVLNTIGIVVVAI